MKATNVSLYIHVPFCAGNYVAEGAGNSVSKCDYCDFFSVIAGNDSGCRMDAFIEAVLADIKYQLEFFSVKNISTVYMGGGTPSVLGPGRIRYLLNSLKDLFKFAPCEFTIEANPESMTEEFLSVCREGGVSRISLGVQSFHEPSRMAVNRAGQAGMLKERLALVSHFFPGAFSVDLITGLPLQTEEIVLKDIEQLLVFNPAHVSLYSLSLESRTPLEQKLNSRIISLPDGETADALWLAGRDALEDAGYEHYEVSSFALPQKRCLHNIRYWQMENWLGAGPVASGTVINDDTGTAKRFSFPADLDMYIEAPLLQQAHCEELDRAALMRDSLLMGFRYCEGPDQESFRRRFGCSVEDCIPETIAGWRDRDIMLFLNTFLSQVFAELDRQGGSRNWERKEIQLQYRAGRI